MRLIRILGFGITVPCLLLVIQIIVVRPAWGQLAGREVPGLSQGYAFSLAHLNMPVMRQTLPARAVVRPNFVGRRQSHGTLWAGSIVALTAANLVDARSSWGKPEANYVLAGSGQRFGTRGAAIKVGINSLWVVSQVAMRRKKRDHLAFVVANFGIAAVFAVSACHNYRIARIR